MIQGFTLLMVFWLLGEAIHAITQIPVSGNVIGMLLLFAYLMLKGSVSTELERTSQLLIAQLSLLLLPGCAGLFFLGARMEGQWLPVLAAIFGATTFTIITTLLLMKWLINRQQPRRHEQLD